MSNRAETGVMEFEGDWPGIFIRGDNAGAYSLLLSSCLESVPESIDKLQLSGLLFLLRGCIVENGITQTVPQKMKKFDDCLGN